MSSQRLPGKVLREINGRPMLAYLLERLRHARELDGIVVATSLGTDDDPVAELCEAEGVSCFRGPLEDVAVRFIAAAEENSLDALVRVNGDSPLLDQRLVDRGVELFRHRGADLVSNVFPRTCPIGESVEVLAVEALRRALPGMEAGGREHVTAGFYAHPDRYSIVAFGPESGMDLSGVSLAVDSPRDAKIVAAILGAMERPHWDYGVEELLELRADAVVAAT